jgi:ATP-dependent DNA ligase
MKLEGILSKRADVTYAPGNRGLWLKVKCLPREEFVVVGWTDPEGSRPYLGAQLPAFHGPYGKLIYAGRVGTRIDTDNDRNFHGFSVPPDTSFVVVPRRNVPILFMMA